MPHRFEIPIPERIRARRRARGLPAYRLAERAGISPSYLSLIESGQKVPSASIAQRLAEVLGDPPELYVAWANADRYPELAEVLDQVLHLRSSLSDPATLERLRSGASLIERDEAEGLVDTFGEPQQTQAHVKRLAPPSLARASSRRQGMLRKLLQRSHGPMAPELVPVPVLADGADPRAIAGGGVVRETLQLDPRMLPRPVEEAFAYRPSAPTLARVSGIIGEGDLVLLARPPARLDPSAVYAVRWEGRVVLSRVLFYDSNLLLLPSAEGGEPVSIPCEDEGDMRDRLAGVVVATLRTWAGEGELGPPPSAQMRLRSRAPAQQQIALSPTRSSARVEDDALVRDCEWRDKYGWRPVQRPEDLDWLEAHPGTVIRFNLIREGRTKYILEMSPEQWRQALGDYLYAGKWRENGYVVAITHKREGAYSEEFQPRWAECVRPVARD